MLELRWTDVADPDVTAVRHAAYSAKGDDLDRFKRGSAWARENPGDCLLVTHNGVPVGTASSLSLPMSFRGTMADVQGVAYVGTVPHQRRTKPSVASAVMKAVLARARERGQAASALMPFRVSFYERFGYGLVERRCEWRVPTSLLPALTEARYRPMTTADLPRVHHLRQQQALAGQCDVVGPTEFWWQETPASRWYIDVTGEQASGYVELQDISVGYDRRLQVGMYGYADLPALRRMLAFIGSMQDQYIEVRVHTPDDLPLNLLLAEAQVPHRQVVHPTAAVFMHTRMQLRVLDNRLLNGAAVPAWAKGEVTVSVAEPEGGVSAIRLIFDDGRVTTGPAGSSAVACDAKTWASIAGGYLPASTAATLGMARGEAQSIALLEALSAGPSPYCRDYF